MSSSGGSGAVRGNFHSKGMSSSGRSVDDDDESDVPLRIKCPKLIKNGKTHSNHDFQELFVQVHKLRNSFNPRQQENIHDGRVTIQPVQRRQGSFVAGTSATKANISGIDRNNLGQQRVVKCFNCKGEGHMARQYPKPKRRRDATWFRDKVLLVEAYGKGKVLNEEIFEFLADPANIVLMANLYSYGSNVLSEVPHSEQVTNCNKVNKDNLIAHESLSAELERYKERVKLLEETQNVELSTREKLIIYDIIQEKNAQFADFDKEINYLKQTLSEQLKENELLTKTFNVFKNESKEKEAKNIDTEIALEKKVKELDNIVC
uniref:CCHC-type domain-containing protein n=1 Tax=Tanacetum cinerariifolium TaxID=118510 RepID=A0A6L2MVG9_TANCI|nr:hypothetical protein [Tanacetum cinerariifolium]